MNKQLFVICALALVMVSCAFLTSYTNVTPYMILQQAKAIVIHRIDVVDFWDAPFWSNIPDIPNLVINGTSNYFQGKVNWNNILNIPFTYTDFVINATNNLFIGKVNWNQVQNKPSVIRGLWNTEVGGYTLTNIGTTYKDIYGLTNFQGEQIIDFNGYNYYRVVWRIAHVGSGTLSLALFGYDESPTTIQFGNASTNTLGVQMLGGDGLTFSINIPMNWDNWLSIPSKLQNKVLITQPFGKSTTNGDDPIFYLCTLELKP